MLESSSAAMPEGVYARSVKSGWWYGAGMVAQKVISLVGFLVLVRLLQPEDYGILAALFVVMGLFDQLTNVPFSDALVQRRGDIERYIDSLWTWDLLRTGFIAIAIFFTAGFFADYFGIQGAARAFLPWTGVFLIIAASGNPRLLYFSRNLTFSPLFIRDVVSQLAAVVASLVYALWVDASFMALVVGQLARYIAGAFMSYVLYPAWPRLTLAFRRLNDLLDFSRWAYGRDLVEYAAGTADRWVVGGIMEVERLGLYTRARDLSLTASSMMASAFDKIGMAAFARVQDEMKKVRLGVLKSVDVFALTSVPFALLLLLEGGTLIPLVLGEQWIGIVLPAKIFSIGSLAFGALSILQPFFSGIGHPKLAFKTRLLQTLLSIPLLYVGGTLYGPVGLAVAVSVSWGVTLLYGLWYARALLQFDRREALPVVVPTLAAVLLTVGIDVALRGTIHAVDVWWVDLGWVAALGCVYVVFVLGVSRSVGHGPFETVQKIMGQLTVRLRRA